MHFALDHHCISLVLSGTLTIKEKSVNSGVKWPNAGLKGSSPTDRETTSSVGDLLQHLNCHSPEDSWHKDSRLITMHKISNGNAAITKQDRLQPP